VHTEEGEEGGNCGMRVTLNVDVGICKKERDSIWFYTNALMDVRTRRRWELSIHCGGIDFCCCSAFCLLFQGGASGN